MRDIPRIIGSAQGVVQEITRYGTRKDGAFTLLEQKTRSRQELERRGSMLPGVAQEANDVA